MPDPEGTVRTARKYATNAERQKAYRERAGAEGAAHHNMMRTVRRRKRMADKQKAAAKEMAEAKPVKRERLPARTFGVDAEGTVSREQAVRESLTGWLLRCDPANRPVRLRAWRKWVDWCAQVNISWLEPPRHAGPAYVDWLLDQYSKGTTGTYTSHVRTALRELRIDGLRTGGDPFDRVKMPKQSWSRDVPRGLAVPIMDVIGAARQVGPRYELLVLILAGMGLRAAEAMQVVDARIEWQQVGTTFRRVVRIIRKGGVEAVLPVPDVLYDLSRVAGWPGEPWPGRAVKYGTPERTREMVRRVADVLGEHLHPHQFRHWHCTTALEMGVPIEIVQDSMGHARTETTQVYNRARHRVEKHTAWTVLPAITGSS